MFGASAQVLVYLSDVEEGGETIFKHEGKGSECLLAAAHGSCC